MTLPQGYSNSDEPGPLPSLSLEGIGSFIGGTRILSAIDWALPTGAQGAILGPNGSGKTLLLRIVTGYLFPSEGSATILGRRLGTVDLHELRREIGLVDPTSPMFPIVNLTTLELVLTGFWGHYCIDFDEPTPRQLDAARAALAEVGLSGHERQRSATLSTGETRRVLLARALVHRPRLLILDEPTAGLDLLARETLLATIERLKADDPTLTVITVTHHLEEIAPGTSAVLLLHQGRALASGAPDRVLTSENLARAFGCPVNVRQEGGRWYWSVQPGTWTQLLQADDWGLSGRGGVG